MADLHPVYYIHQARSRDGVVTALLVVDLLGIIETVRGLVPAHPELGAESLLLAALREQQPDMEAVNKTVREALAALKDSKAPALLNLKGDEQRIIFDKLINVLDPGIAVAFATITRHVRALTRQDVEKLRGEHEEATVLCFKANMESCKVLREAEEVEWNHTGLTPHNLESLGKLGAKLLALKKLTLCEPGAGPDGVQQLAEKLVAGALPAVTKLELSDTYVGDAGASALAAALDRGALPRLKTLALRYAAIGDAGLVALAPALRRRPALEALDLDGNPFGDEGLAALVAPPPADAPPPQAEALAKLKVLNLNNSQITDDGCAHLASRLRSGALPALEYLYLPHTLAGDLVYEARPDLVIGYG